MRCLTTPTRFFFCLLFAFSFPVSVLADGEDDSPREQAIEATSDRSRDCLALIVEQDRIKDQISERVAETSGPITTLGMARAILEHAYDANEHQQLAQHLAELAEQISVLRSILDGDAPPNEPGLTRVGLLTSLHSAMREHEQTIVLHEVSGIEDEFDRAARHEEAVEELHRLRELMNAELSPLKKRLGDLERRSTDQNQSLARAMQPLGLLGDATGLGIQAVQFSAVQLGSIRAVWTDGRGRDVASANLRLRLRPDTHDSPPDVLERFHTLFASDGKVELSVGFFLVEFDTNVQDIVDEPQVLGLLIELLDLNALGDVQPDRSENGLN